MIELIDLATVNSSKKKYSLAKILYVNAAE